ncbi:MAG TPA: hypothetical protein VMZ22_04915 [Acidimicrobiales bacterium]|nr:hypothetical protein [Acidimicrobiales bacterium]
MNRRATVLWLSAIALVGLVRGGWWVAVTEAYSPVDEVAHVDYVATMAEHGRAPEVGADLVRNELLELAKASATSPWRPSPVSADRHDPRWGAFAHSYEGVQPPAYYAMLAAPWKLFHGYGALAMLYILRVLTLLIALAVIPFTSLLARELLARRPEIGLAAPALLVTLGGFNANLASVTNDAMVMTVSTAALWLTARTWNRGYRSGSAVAVGATVGAAVLSKSTGLALVPMVALGALGPLWTRGAVARRYLAWGFQCGGAATAVVVPWLLWNRATYSAWSASDAVDKITGPLQPPIPRTLDGVVTHLKSAVQAFWGAQLSVTRIGHHAVFFTLAGAAVLLVAALVHLRRWRPTRDALAIAWMAAAVPVALLTMIGIIAGVFGGSSSVVGRHLYPALPALGIAIVAGLVTVLGRRVGLVALALLIAVGLTLERADTNRYVNGTYTRGVELGLTPVAGQSRGDAAVPGPLSVHLEADCKIGGIGIEFADDFSPVTIRFSETDARPAVPRITRVDAGGGVFAFYPTPAIARRLDVDVPDTAKVSAGLRSASNETLVPTALAYCDKPNPTSARFAALFDAQHPDWSLRFATAWPTMWAVFGWLGFAATVLANVLRRHRDKPAD